MQVTIQCLRYLGDTCTNFLECLHGNCNGEIILNFFCLALVAPWTLSTLPTPCYATDCCNLCVWRVQSLKTYQLYHGEWQQAEGKMRHVDNQKLKLERQQSAGSGVAVAKSALSRRFRNFEKLSEKVICGLQRC